MANPWKRLRGLLPGEVQQIGTVSAVNADGTSDVDLIGGGTVTVSGDGYSVSDRVFIKGSAILSGAPTFTVTDILV